MAYAGRLEVLHDTQTIINTYLHILHNANSRWDYFADAGSLSQIPSAFEVIKKAIFEAKARGTRLRFITEMPFLEELSKFILFQMCFTPR